MDDTCLYGYTDKCPILTRINSELQDTYEYDHPNITTIKYLAVSIACLTCPYTKERDRSPRQEMMVKKKVEDVAGVREIKPVDRERRGEASHEHVDKVAVAQLVKEQFGDLVDVEVTEDYIKIIPKRYLGEAWSEINRVLREKGLKWVSKGRDSHWLYEEGGGDGR